jgi:preprotein translocase subunit Sec63
VAAGPLSTIRLAEAANEYDVADPHRLTRPHHLRVRVRLALRMRCLFALVTWLVVGSLMGITVWLALIEISLR